MAITLTPRQQNEADVYDQRAGDLDQSLSDDDLSVEADRPPYPNREHEAFLDHLLARVGRLDGLRVLEVGCGSGAMSTWFALQGARPVGVDVSAGMLRIAARRARVNGVGDTVEIRQSAVETLADPAGAYDVVFANQVLHHLELDEAMANIRRLLRPGGLAIFSEPVFLLPKRVRSARYHGGVLRFFPSRADTPDERPLDRAALEVVRRHFAGLEITPFQLLARLQNFHHLSDPTFRRLERIDRTLLRAPGSISFARYLALVGVT